MTPSKLEEKDNFYERLATKEKTGIHPLVLFVGGAMFYLLYLRSKIR